MLAVEAALRGLIAGAAVKSVIRVGRRGKKSVEQQSQRQQPREKGDDTTMANMNKILKQAQQMQSQMAQVQEEIAGIEKQFTAGGGAVEVTARGDHSITNIKIAPSAIDPDDAEGLEDLILTAVNGALDDVKATAEKRMKDVTGGMNLPGIM